MININFVENPFLATFGGFVSLGTQCGCADKRESGLQLALAQFLCYQQTSSSQSQLMPTTKQHCAQYKYVVTPSGPKIVAVPDHDTEYSAQEESASEYNTGGYCQVKVKDTFKDGRYTVIRKLG